METENIECKCGCVLFQYDSNKLSSNFNCTYIDNETTLNRKIFHLLLRNIFYQNDSLMDHTKLFGKVFTASR